MEEELQVRINFYLRDDIEGVKHFSWETVNAKECSYSVCVIVKSSFQPNKPPLYVSLQVHRY